MESESVKMFRHGLPYTYLYTSVFYCGCVRGPSVGMIYCYLRCSTNYYLIKMKWNVLKSYKKLTARVGIFKLSVVELFKVYRAGILKRSIELEVKRTHCTTLSPHAQEKVKIKTSP